MDKNVGSVDLEELKRVREELNRERGIENDPNMYSNYNPDRNKEDNQNDSAVESSSMDSEEKSMENFSNHENQDNTNASDFNNETVDNFNNSEPINFENFEVNQNQQIESSQPQEIENNFENNNSISESTTTEMNTQNKANEDDEKPAEKDFSVYDNFAAFEVNDGKPVSFNEDNGELIGDEPDLMLKKSDYIDTHDSENQNEQSSENLSNETETHGELTEKKPKDYLIEVTPIESEQLSNQNINLDNNIASNNEDKVEYDFSGGEDNDDEVETISDEEFMKLLNGEDIEGLDDEKTDEEKKENIVTQNTDTQANKIENNGLQSDDKTEGSNEDNLDELLKQGKLGELLIDNQENNNQEVENTISEDKVESEEVNQNQPQITENDEENKPFTTDKNEENQTEPNTSFFRRRKPDYESTINYREVNQANFEKQNKAYDLNDDEVIEKEDDDFYHEIDSFNFIDVISADEFKDNGNLTYILGKDEENKTIYSNLKDSLNFVIFGNNKEDISAELNSVIISLMLKNSVDDINLIICDTDKSSKFRVYDGSNYMFFNRVANSNREIFDAFSEISIEINSRYDKFASMSVKNLDDYNLKVDANNKLPYLLVIYNNYSNNENAEFYDEINSSLFSMLKLGRLVGVYVILTSNSKIDNPSINYNFPTRLAFKQETEDESVSTLGVNNASKIKGESEFIWFSVLENMCLHLIAPSLSDNEVKNLIQTIENN